MALADILLVRVLPPLAFAVVGYPLMGLNTEPDNPACLLWFAGILVREREREREKQRVLVSVCLCSARRRALHEDRRVVVACPWCCALVAPVSCPVVRVSCPFVFTHLHQLER